MQIVAELLACGLQALVFDGLLPTVGVISQEVLLVSYIEGQGHEVPRPVVLVVAEVLAPDGHALHICVAAPSEDLLAQPELCRGREAVEVAQKHVIAIDVAYHALVVRCELEFQLRLAERLEACVAMAVVFILVAALESGYGAVLGQPYYLFQALGMADKRDAAKYNGQKLSHAICRLIMSLKSPPLAMSSS